MRDSETQSERIPSEFAVSIHEDGDSTMVAISGELDLAHSTVVESALAQAETGKGPIVIDLSNLTFLDSVGVAILLMARGRDRHNGLERLRFIAPTRDEVMTVLVRTGTAAELF
jgi:anti-anti-sigma factor